MMGSKQNQEASGNSIAVQAGGDVNIGADIHQVMQAVQLNIGMFSEVARAIVDERLANFELRLVEKFSTGSVDAVQSFSDPDFQGSLHKAKSVYARSSSDELNDVLADLVYRRALEVSRNRIALTLNEAIDRSANLSRTDFINLAVLFYILCTTVHGKISVEYIAERFKEHIGPFVGELDLDEYSLDYLHSQGLFLVGPSDRSLKPNPLEHVIKTSYSEAFNTGMSGEEIEDIPALSHNIIREVLVRPCYFDKDKYVLNITIGKLRELELKHSLYNGIADAYSSKVSSRLASNDAVAEAITRHFPQYSVLSKKYNSSRAGVIKLSAVGVAIAHSFIAQNTGFSGALSLWLRP